MVLPSFTPALQHSPGREGLLSSHLLWWGNWGSDMLSDFSEVVQLMKGRDKVESRSPKPTAWLSVGSPVMALVYPHPPPLRWSRPGLTSPLISPFCPFTGSSHNGPRFVKTEERRGKVTVPNHLQEYLRFKKWKICHLHGEGRRGEEALLGVGNVKT